MLLLDFDEIQKYPKEQDCFRTLYQQYEKVKSGEADTAKLKWMKQLTILINNPCLEYWHLLHFKNVAKHYNRYEPELKRDLQSIDALKDYEKSEKYHTKSPQIFVRTSGKDGSRIITVR